jgi:sulfate adenylyltransferase subunit 2
MSAKNYQKNIENQTVYIVREVKSQFSNPAMLWSMGKDSTTLLWLVRKSFFGTVPFPVIHIDTGLKFPEMYKFRDNLVKKLGLNLVIARNDKAIKKGINPETTSRFRCCTLLKTIALKECINKHGFDALILAIRRDEHSIRAKERYFSPRNSNFKWDYKNQPPEFWDLYKASIEKDVHHYRVHPLLHWTELDVWTYMQREQIPVNPLYFSNNGKRYRSLGCVTCTYPVESNATDIFMIVNELKNTDISERSGRSQDKEKKYMMQKLRSLGYM